MTTSARDVEYAWQTVELMKGTRQETLSRMKLGGTLRVARVAAGLSLKFMSDDLGLTIQEYERMEHAGYGDKRLWQYTVALLRTQEAQV